MNDELKEFIELVNRVASEKIDLTTRLLSSNKEVCEYILQINYKGQCSRCRASYIPVPKTIKSDSKKNYTRNYRCKCPNSTFSACTGTRLEKSPLQPTDWMKALYLEDKSFQSIKHNIGVANDTASSLPYKLRPQTHEGWKEMYTQKIALKERSDTAIRELYKIIRKIEEYVKAEDFLLGCNGILRVNDPILFNASGSIKRLDD